MLFELPAALTGSPYVSYAYAYPHKSAYRPLTPPVPLDALWSGEERDALFLYFHIPFCEMRCGFCNLFTTANPSEEMEDLYLDAFERQARQVRTALGGDSRFTRMALGGGTPTYLSVAGLHRLFGLAESLFGVNLGRIPLSVETSPRTAESEKLHLLRERGVDRVSIGVQTFNEREIAAIGRAQKTALVEQALDNIREAHIPTLNIDLMYGLPGQSLKSWETSLRMALCWSPEELYLYPLYVRPLTGMGRRQTIGEWDDQRLDHYRAAVALLHDAGYEQISMRMFRAPHAPPDPVGVGPVYCCQEDNMVGVGCGARSYTRALHYSSEYAVGRAGVRSIIADYLSRSDNDFAHADYGVRLTPDEQRRRYLIYTLLTTDGVDLSAYRRHFGTVLLDDLPQLTTLIDGGFAALTPQQRLRLTPNGLERSDAVGPWLYSSDVHTQMETFALK